MTAVNHVLTGALIGATVHQPVVAILIALISHFILDALPHYGYHGDWQARLRHRKFLNGAAAYDVIILAVTVYLLLQASPGWLVIACATAAVIPDVAWVYRYTIPERWGTKAPTKGNKLTQFHTKIQRYEFHQGIYIEVFTTMLLGFIATKVF